MTKILHIITRLDMGGSAQNTLQTCRGLAAEYRIVLVHGLSIESGMTGLEKQTVERQVQIAVGKGAKVIPLPHLVRKIDPINDTRTFWSLFRIIKKEKPVIVHTHTSKAGILGRWSARLARVPIIVHTTHGHVFYGHFGPLASKIFLLAEKLTANVTDHMIALTDSERGDFLKFGICGLGKTASIHSGVDLSKFYSASNGDCAKKKALGLDGKKVVIGTIGWLLPIKGPDVLLKAMGLVWQMFPDVQLVYVGKGEMLDELKSAARQMNVEEKVFFLGWRNDVNEILPLFDIFVLPSLNEGMGRVLVEAMAAGKPIVASNTGGIPDLVTHARNGLLVPPGDVSGFSGAIAWMLRNPDRAERMGAYGRNDCSKFTLEAMLEKIDGLYGNLIKEYLNPEEH